MTSDPVLPTDVDSHRPNVARMYDYYLGGCHNFAVDRAAARQILEIFPDTPAAAQTNRHFLRRAVRYLAGEAGVRQFLDIGAGLPTQGSVHEITGEIDPDARVVYVDHDPVAVAHARQILTDAPNATVVRADLRRPGQLLDDPEVRDAIDLAQPVAVLLVSILHFVADDADPWGLVAGLRDATAPGSWLAISHLTTDGAPPLSAQQSRAVYQRSSAPISPRTGADIRRLFDGYELVDPGLVPVADWRPEAVPDGGHAEGVSHMYAGVGRRS